MPEIHLEIPGRGAVEAAAGETAREILARVGVLGDAIAARLNGRPVDLSSRVEADGRLAPVAPASPEGLEVIRHSTAHLMAQAVKRLFPSAQITIGPVIEDGFYYDFSFERAFTPEDLERIEAEMQRIATADLAVARTVEARDAAVARFLGMGEKYKAEIIGSIPAGDDVSLYGQGDFVDLCRGPHVPNTGLFRALRFHKVGGSHWEPAGPPPPTASAALARLLAQHGSSMAPSGKASGGGGGGGGGGELLQRVYGTAFPTPAQLAAWQANVDEARRRDHRVVGAAQQLFFFHKLSPGSAFLLPHGTRIYNRLVAMLRAEYRARGYEEVRSPLVFKNALWRTSGHLQAYAENMFSVTPGIGAATTATAAAVAGPAASGDASCSHGPGGVHSHSSPPAVGPRAGPQRATRRRMLQRWRPQPQRRRRRARPWASSP